MKSSDAVSKTAGALKELVGAKLEDMEKILGGKPAGSLTKTAAVAVVNKTNPNGRIVTEA